MVRSKLYQFKQCLKKNDHIFPILRLNIILHYSNFIFFCHSKADSTDLTHKKIIFNQKSHVHITSTQAQFSSFRIFQIQIISGKVIEKRKRQVQERTTCHNIEKMEKYQEDIILRHQHLPCEIIQLYYARII